MTRISLRLIGKSRSQSRMIQESVEIFLHTALLIDFWPAQGARRKHIPRWICDRQATRRRPKINATLRAKAIWGTWRRCSLVSGPYGHAPCSRLAIRPKLLSRGVYEYFNTLLGFWLGQPQQFGANRQTCCPNGIQIYTNSNFVVLGHKPDHSSARDEIFGVTHGKHTASAESGKNLFQAFSSGSTNEEHMAGFDLRYPAIPLNDQWAIVHPCATNSFVQISTEGIFSQHSNHQMCARRRESLRGPLNKLNQVEKKNSLYLIFRRGAALRPQV